MTFGEWLPDYLQLYKRRLAAKTRESYERCAQLLAPSLGALPLEAITPDLLQRALLIVEERAGSRQAQIAYALLHASLRRAVRSGHLAINPADAIDKPEHEGRAGRAITPEDWEQLLPAILAEPGLALAAFAGLRRGEVLAIRRRDIDLAAGVIHVHAQRVRVGGKLAMAKPKSSAGVRDVPLLPELAAALAPTMRYLLPNALLVPIAPETLDRRWQRAQELAGIAEPYRLHDLRHTWASRLVAAGINMRILQYAIGHSDYKLTVRTYTHIGPREAVSEFSRVAGALH